MGPIGFRVTGTPGRCPDPGWRIHVVQQPGRVAGGDLEVAGVSHHRCCGALTGCEYSILVYPQYRLHFARSAPATLQMFRAAGPYVVGSPY